MEKKREITSQVERDREEKRREKELEMERGEREREREKEREDVRSLASMQSFHGFADGHDDDEHRAW